MGVSTQAVSAGKTAIPYRFMRYAAFTCALAILGLGVMQIRLDETTYDLWQHLAAIRTLSADLLFPTPLFLNEAYEVHLYTPYHLFWAAVMALGQVNIWSILTVSSIMNALLFMIGCHELARRVIGDARLDFVLFATMLLFWGAPAWWSGIYSLAQFTLVIGYPSTFAFSAAMIVGAIYFEPGFRTIAWQAGFTAALALLFVIHPITTSFLLVFLAVKVSMSPGIGIRGLVWAAWPAAGVFLGFFWPYFSVLELVLAARSSPDFFGDFDVFYQNPLLQIGPAILGFGAITACRESRPIKFILALLAILLIIYLGNYALHLSHILSRYLIFIAFALHLLLVAWIASLPDPKAKMQLLGFLFIIGIAAGIYQTQADSPRSYGLYWDLVAGTPLGTHSAARQYRDLEDLGIAIPISNATVLAPTAWAYPLTALTGAKVVALRYDAPTIANGEARRADVARFYNPVTACAERADILRRRNADYILSIAGENGEDTVGACAWQEVYRGGRFVLYTVQREPGS